MKQGLVRCFNDRARLRWDLELDTCFSLSPHLPVAPIPRNCVGGEGLLGLRIL